MKNATLIYLAAFGAALFLIYRYASSAVYEPSKAVKVSYNMPAYFSDTTFKGSVVTPPSPNLAQNATPVVKPYNWFSEACGCYGSMH